MPLNCSFCLHSSTTSLENINYTSDQPITSQKEVERIESRGGYIVTNKTIKTNDIRPVKTALHPKLRMTEKDFKNYRDMMINLGCLPDKVSFAEKNNAVVSAVENPPDPEVFPPCPANALLSSDSDYVSFEEYEPFRLKRLQKLSIPTEINVLEKNHKKFLATACDASPDQHSFYDRPREKPISTNYDLPATQAISVNYAIPGKKPIPAHYDIPRKKPLSTAHNTQNSKFRKN